jgi:MurNAc alpha-1-phosphate uridylyltransferase
MILAAGRGQRMRPLTDTTPKPLLKVGGKALIEWHIERLADAGIVDIVVNHAWLGSCITQALGDGRRYGVRIRYSPEEPALETAGGIAHALTMLGDAPFLVVNGDTWCDWDPRQALTASRTLLSEGRQAWLLLAPNPPHHPQGDFCLDDDGNVSSPAPTIEHHAANGRADTLTFTGIGVYQPSLFGALPANRPAPLAPILRDAMARGQVLGRRFGGRWLDIGTPQRLYALDRQIGHARDNP